MKEFNLEEYLKNPSQKVVTRDGRNVRIICTDAMRNLPIVALVFDKEQEEEIVVTFQKDGKYIYKEEQPLDLFFAPTKREGWINIYFNIYYEGSDKCRNSGKNIYSSEEEAKKHKDLGYITTIRIEWKE